MRFAKRTDLCSVYSTSCIFERVIIRPKTIARSPFLQLHVNGPTYLSRWAGWHLVLDFFCAFGPAGLESCIGDAGVADHFGVMDDHIVAGTGFE